MKNSRRKTVLLAAVALALLAALAFLFARTQGTSYKDGMQALSLLRELRDMDARWDMDGLRLANDLARAPEAPDRGPVIARIFQELEHGSARGAVGSQVPALRAAMAEKDAAFRALRLAHGESLRTLDGAREQFMALATAAEAHRSRSPRHAERGAALLGDLERLRSMLRVADIEAQPAREQALEPGVATLVPAALEVDPALGPTARAAEAAVREHLRARAGEAEAWRKFAFLTVGARIDRIARGLDESIAHALDDKERWRVYLLTYALALLVGVGHLGLRLIATRAQLREANQGLEQRVAARTRELEQALAQLKESEAQLVQTEKMSSLGQMVAGVAHEINTPLAYVKNSVATVRDRLPELRETLAAAERLLATLQSPAPDGDELQQAFEALSTRLARLEEHQVLDDLRALAGDGLHGIEQIAELVANLRRFSRLDRSRVASFNVNEGVRASLLIAKPALRKVDVDKRLGDIPSITCSPSQVNQVILNLVTNAAQAIDKPRGRISVATRASGPDAIAIEVEDNGRGIAPEALGRIFDPFYTTKEPGKGTGLGLTIAYKIVAQHGGRIDVRSQPGVGTTFVVTLPLMPPEIDAAAEAAEEDAPA